MHHYPALLGFEGAGILVVTFSEDKQPFDKVCIWFMCWKNKISWGIFFIHSVDTLSRHFL